MIGNAEAPAGLLSGQSFSSVTDVFRDSQLQGLITSGFSEVGSVIKLASGAFGTAFQAIHGALKSAFDFVKFDIFTTFFQELGLWFTNMNFPKKFDQMFHKFMSFVSLIWAYVLSLKELQMFYIWGILACFLFLVWIIQKHYDPKLELQGPNTFGWENRGTLWLLWTRGLVTVLTFLYLPCATSCFNVIFCMKKLMTEYELNCYEGIHWVHFIIAFFIFFFIGIYFPWEIYQVINMYKPVPQNYDENGNLIASYDRKKFLDQYRQLMDRDKCPYNFLYVGYEYGWSAYKVITMVVKMLLVIPMTPLIAEQYNVATSLSLVIVTVYAITSCIMRPFILECDDYIDLCSRITAVLTLVVQISLINKAISDEVSGILVTVINIVNLVIMVLIFITNVDIFKNFIHSHFGSLTVAHGLAYDNNECRKQRIWQRFWRGLLQSCASLRPAYDRLIAMEDIVKKYGLAKYRDSLFPPTPAIAQCRRMARELEGVDVFYHGNKEEKSYWGRMYIVPFPFHCVMVYDESSHTIDIDDRFIEDFIAQNFRDQTTVRSRQFRQYLRCLNGEYVNYPLEKELPVKKGLSKVNVNLRFERGLLRVETQTNDPFCHGFHLTISYEDGCGTLPNGQQVEGYKYVAGIDDLGISPDYLISNEVPSLVTEPGNRAIIQGKWDEFIMRNKMYRDDLEEWREEEEKDASWGFWYMVFNNDRAPLEVIEDYVKRFEPNPELQGLFQLYADDFKALETRLKYYDAHPAISLWYNFWDDIALKNSDMKQIKKHPELFDVTNPEAIIYHPMTRDELDEKLIEAGLRKSNGKGLFHNGIINELNEKLEKLGREENAFKAPPFVRPVSENVKFDPRCIGTPLMTENVTFIASAAMMVL